jgi:hypothetical protein
MKTLIAAALFASLAFGCSHNAPATQEAQPAPMTTTEGAQNAQAEGVDPTLPSWAPKSCNAYHAAVVKFSHCGDIALDLRDKVAAKYDADTKSWHDMENAQQSDLDQVKVSCGDQQKSVSDQMTGHCAPGAQQAQN